MFDKLGGARDWLFDDSLHHAAERDIDEVRPLLDARLRYELFVVRVVFWALAFVALLAHVMLATALGSLLVQSSVPLAAVGVVVGLALWPVLRKPRVYAETTVLKWYARRVRRLRSADHAVLDAARASSSSVAVPVDVGRDANDR